jgi:hypothetical protein
VLRIMRLHHQSAAKSRLQQDFFIATRLQTGATQATFSPDHQLGFLQ